MKRMSNEKKRIIVAFIAVFLAVIMLLSVIAPFIMS